MLHWKEAWNVLVGKTKVIDPNTIREEIRIQQTQTVIDVMNHNIVRLYSFVDMWVEKHGGTDNKFDDLYAAFEDKIYEGKRTYELLLFPEFGDEYTDKICDLIYEVERIGEYIDDGGCRDDELEEIAEGNQRLLKWMIKHKME